jgi:hypothetical protein
LSVLLMANSAVAQPHCALDTLMIDGIPEATPDER